jgi:U4/U6 small nuclear ribonucleoprotein PRP31
MLGDDELKKLEEACDMALELNQSKHQIYEYVESRMSFIAPNVSIIVGASTAAKIMGECYRKHPVLPNCTFS